MRRGSWNVSEGRASQDVDRLTRLFVELAEKYEVLSGRVSLLEEREISSDATRRSSSVSDAGFASA